MAGLSTQGGRPMAIREAVGDADDGLSLDTVYHLLQNQRRRQIIRYLVETDGPVTRDEIVGWITKLEADPEGEYISSQARQRVYVALHQTHLPKLDRADILEYGPDRGTVAPRAALEELYGILENTTRASAVEATSDSIARPQQRLWKRSAALGIACGMVFGVFLGGFRPGFASDRLLFTAFVLVIAVGIAALYHLFNGFSHTRS